MTRRRPHVPGQVDFEQDEHGIVITARPSDGAAAAVLHVMQRDPWQTRRPEFVIARRRVEVRRRATRTLPASVGLEPRGIVRVYRSPDTAVRNALRIARLYARRPAPQRADLEVAA